MAGGPRRPWRRAPTASSTADSIHPREAWALGQCTEYRYLRMHEDMQLFEMPTEALVSVASASRLLSDPTRIQLL